MTGRPGSSRRPWLAAVGILLAAAGASIGARGPCALCSRDLPIADLHPIAPGAAGLLVCPDCLRVATPPTAHPLP